MNEAKYPSKERVEIDGVLIHAEGDDLLSHPDEAKRQGYKVEDAQTITVSKRVERDGFLVAAEGDVLPVAEAKELGVSGDKHAATKVAPPAQPADKPVKKAPAKRAK